MSEQDATMIDLGEDAGRPRRRRLSIYIAAGLVLVILVGVGGVVWWRMRFAGPQPADRLPGSLVAYAGIDLAPGPEQQARLLSLAHRFPRLGTTAGDVLSPERIFRAIGASTPINFTRDVQPWLGVRAGLGAWFDEQKHPYAVIAAASTNDAAARAGLSRIRDELGPGTNLGFVVENRVALIVIGDAGAPAAALAAQAEARAHPFSESSSYVAARRWLGGDQVAVVWVDNARFNDLVYSRPVLDGGTGGGGPAGPPTPRGTGTFVLGLTATGQGLEARFRSFGSAAATPVPDALTRLGALPSESAIAAVVRLPDDFFGAAGVVAPEPLGIVSALVGFGALSVLGPMDVGAPRPDRLTPAEQREVEQLLAKEPAALTDAARARLKELFGFDPTTPPGPARELTAAEQREAEALLRKDPQALTAAEAARLKELTGFEPNGIGPFVPDDSDPVFDLAGAIITAAVSTLSPAPTLRAVIETTSAEKARHLGTLAGPDLTLTVDGQTVMAVSRGYTPTESRLADRAEFRQALTGAPEGISMAVYVDLRRIVPPAHSAELGGLSAVAVLVGVEGGDQTGLIRLLVA